jgi:pyocin large subunit-like protein
LKTLWAVLRFASALVWGVIVACSGGTETATQQQQVYAASKPLQQPTAQRTRGSIDDSRSTSPSSQSAPRRPMAGVGFRSRHLLDEHFAKHGAEFGRVTEDDYLRAAQALRDAPAIGKVEELRRPDGSISKYDRATGAFIAFDSTGIIRTFFKPNDGEAYFRRQARRSR